MIQVNVEIKQMYIKAERKTNSFNIHLSSTLIWRLIVLLLLSNSKDDENQNSQD